MTMFYRRALFFRRALFSLPVLLMALPGMAASTAAAVPTAPAEMAPTEVAQADAGDPASMGPLVPFLTTGTDSSGWTSRFDGSAYVLENPGAPGVVKYVHAGSAGGVPGARTLSVAVKVAAQGGTPGQSAAGLLYGLTPGPSYFAFVLTGERQVALLHRTPSGIEQLIGLAGDMVGGDAVTLGITEKNGGIALTLNGRDVAVLARQDVGIGDVGIIAIGTGRFSFGGFRSRSP